MKKYIYQEKKTRNTKQFRINKKKEHKKISKLLNNSNISNFSKRKWIEVNDLTGSDYSVNKKKPKKTKQERLKTSNLRSDLSDYSDPDIFLKGK